MIKQHTDEWYEARLGKVTASRFGDVLCLPRSKKDQEEGKLSKTADAYMMELITETLTGEARKLDRLALEWGTEHETEARELFELENLTEVQEAGFEMIHDLIGGSPDGYIGDKGIVEIKCPYNSGNHVNYLYGKPLSRNYIAQIQGNLWITNREFCFFISYDPRMKDDKHKLHVRTILRDINFIDKELEPTIERFITIYKRKLKKLDISLD